MRKNWSLPIRRRMIVTVTTLVFGIAFIAGQLFDWGIYEAEDHILQTRLRIELDALEKSWIEQGQITTAASRLMQASFDGAGLPSVVREAAIKLPVGIHELDMIDLGEGKRDMHIGIRRLSDDHRLVVWYKTWFLEEAEKYQYRRLFFSLLAPLYLPSLPGLSCRCSVI